ncbi:hypothetical protein KGP36_06515 [Patescibacteria group bacterium]|nr:hypothetical protein [Patescibacteria group bacterium]
MKIKWPSWLKPVLIAVATVLAVVAYFLFKPRTPPKPVVSSEDFIQQMNAAGATKEAAQAVLDSGAKDSATLTAAVEQAKQAQVIAQFHAAFGVGGKS